MGKEYSKIKAKQKNYMRKFVIWEVVVDVANTEDLPMKVCNSISINLHANFN